MQDNSENDDGSTSINWESVDSEIQILNERDLVNNPSHYKTGNIEVLEAIEAWALPYNLGNVIKYCARAGHKDPGTDIEDLRKAKWYLSREIELRLALRENRKPCAPSEMEQV